MASLGLTSGLTRRRLLTVAGAGLGGGALAVTGLSALGAGETAISLPEATMGVGEGVMSSRVLVAYASRAGSTAGIAEAIGRTLAERGAQVDVRPMERVDDLASYRAVVAGSAIRGGKWLPEALQFVRANQAVLTRKPFAAFLVCATMGSPNPAYRQGVAAWLEPVRSLVRPVSEGLFAGDLDFGRLPLNLNTAMLRVAVTLGALPGGDRRDWVAIRIWAASISPRLVG